MNATVELTGHGGWPMSVFIDHQGAPFFAGLRPLVANNKSATTTKLSREHTVDRPAPGFVSIAGGKYTTYRVMGKDAIDRAVIELRKLTSASVTEKLPLVGADGFFALEQQAEAIALESGLTPQDVTHLLNRYGSLINEILTIIKETPKLAQKLDESLPYLKADLATHCRGRIFSLSKIKPKRVSISRIA
jgi:glycerol-3-phosphate dehydrogenase